MADLSQVGHMASALPFLTILSLTFVALRIFSKRRYGKLIDKDDYTLMLSWLSLLTSLVLVIAAIGLGYGKHFYEIEPIKSTQVAKLVAVSEFFAILAVALSKTSIAMTLLTVAHKAQKQWLIILTWFLVVSVDLFTLGLAIFALLTVWNGILVTACMAGKRVWDFAVFAAAWSAGTDFIFAILPAIVIWDLQMSRTKRFGIVFVMSLGLASAITATVKIGHISCKDFNLDVTHESVPLVIWTFTEPAVIIMAASAPPCRLLIEEIYETMAARRRLQDENSGEVAFGWRSRLYLSSSTWRKGSSGQGTCTITSTAVLTESAISLQSPEPVLIRTGEV